MHPQEAVGQNAAFKKGSQLLFHESRNGAFPFTLLRYIGFEMTGDNAVKGIVFGISGMIFGGGFKNY